MQQSLHHIAVSKEIVLEITDLAYGGKGVGRTEEGKVCFVRDVIPGERVVVRIVREKRDFAEADLVEIQEGSADRVAPPCEYFGRCGGCSYQHLSYPAQLSAKKKQVETTLKRIGNLEDVHVQPVLSAPQPYHYRNRITVHTREGITGFYEREGRKVMDIRHCMLAAEPVNQALQQYQKRSPYDGVCTLPLVHLAGFRQTNDLVAALLLEEVAKQAGSGELLVDAYCGAGFFAKRLRTQFEKVIGLEWNAQAVAAAQAEMLPHESYWEGDVAQLLPAALGDSAASGGKNSVLLVNPPAQGLSSEVTQAILERPLQRLLYISCNVATLARDLKKLIPSTYRLHSMTPLDMFPQTAEIEVIALLTVS